MLNAEKFRNEILSDEGNELNKVFSTCDKNIGKSPSYNGLIRWLLSEYQEPPILDEVEREYLSAVCRPYKVINIRKACACFNNEWIEIIVDSNVSVYNASIKFPLFKENTMYKGMEVDKKYTPQELGITCKNNPNGEIKND